MYVKICLLLEIIFNFVINIHLLCCHLCISSLNLTFMHTDIPVLSMLCIVGSNLYYTSKLVHIGIPSFRNFFKNNI